MIPVNEKVIVCYSNFQNKERKWIKYTVYSLGGTYEPTLDLRTATHLVLYNLIGEKYEAWKKFSAASGVHNVCSISSKCIYLCHKEQRWVSKVNNLVKESSGGHKSYLTPNHFQ